VTICNHDNKERFGTIIHWANNIPPVPQAQGVSLTFFGRTRQSRAREDLFIPMNDIMSEEDVYEKQLLSATGANLEAFVDYVLHTPCKDGPGLSYDVFIVLSLISLAIFHLNTLVGNMTLFALKMIITNNSTLTYYDFTHTIIGVVAYPFFLLLCHLYRRHIGC